MKKDIFEAVQPMATAAAVIEKSARQLLYDSRYKVNQKLGEKKKKIDRKTFDAMVLQQISKSKGPAAERAKQMLLKSRSTVKEDFIPLMEDAATNSVAKALYKVFVEGVQKEEVVELPYVKQLAEEKETKYKIRVTDLKTGNSYVRYGTREKITQLRAKGLKVEMTEHGEPREGERKRGESTASALGGGRKAKRDYDGDGKVESSSKEHAGVVHNAIQRATGGTPDGKDTRKEDYLWTEGTTSTEGQNSKKIDVMKNGETNNVKIFPQDGSEEPRGGVINAGVEFEGPILTEKALSRAQQRFMGMVYAVKKGEKPMSPEVAAAAKGMTKKEAKKFAKTKHKGLPEKVEESMCGDTDEKKKDTRGDYAKINLIKNKLRAMGAKNPIVMVASEETVEEGMGLSVGASRLGAAILSNPKTPYEQGARNLQRNLTDPVGFAIKGAIKSAANTLGAGTNTNDKMMQKRQPQTPLQKQVAARTQQVVNSYEPEGELVDEAAEDRARDEHQERGGMAARVDYDRPPAKKKTNKELGIRDFTPAEKKKRAKEMSAHLKKMRG